MALMIGLGELLWDVFPDGRLPGGAPANFAHHAVGLGHRGLVISRVGDDRAGLELLEKLRDRGIDTTHVQIDPDHPTGTVEVRVAADGSPTFTPADNVAFDHLADTPDLHRAIRQSDVVCFGTIAQRTTEARATTESLLGYARGTVLFDINLRRRFWSLELVEAGLGFASAVKLNAGEQATLQAAGLLPEVSDKPSWCRELLRAHRLDLVCLTRGDRGCLLVDRKGFAEHSGFRVEVVDTVGCGDAVSAALAHGLSSSMPIDDIAAFANRVGAHVATKQGATPALPPELKSSYGLHKKG